MSGLAGYISARRIPDAALTGEALLAALPGVFVKLRSLFTDGALTLLHSGTVMAGTGKSGGPLSRRFGARLLTAAMDGQLYNAAKLRDQLRALGHHIHTLCDTELVLLAYLEWGRDAPSRLEGVFALAIWDSERETLFLARDRMGVKPLYMAWPEGLPLFATDASVLLRYPGLKHKLAAEGACRLLCPSPCEPCGAEVLCGVESLPPGHWILWHKGTTEKGCYFCPEIPPLACGAQTAQRLFTEALTQALACRREGARPLVSHPSDPLSRMLCKAVPEAKPLPLHVWDDGPLPPANAAVITGEDAAVGFTDAVIYGGRPDFTAEEAVSMLLWRQASRHCSRALSAVGAYTLLSGKPPVQNRLPTALVCEPYRKALAERGMADRESFSDDTYTALSGLLQMTHDLPERAERLAVYAGLELRLPFTDPAFASLIVSLPHESRTAILGTAFPLPLSGKMWKSGIASRFHGLLSQNDAALWQLCRRDILQQQPSAAGLQARLLMVSTWLTYFKIDLV